MIIKQLSIFLENKSGRISEVTSLLGRENINIRALTLADSADFGVMRLIVDKLDDAVACLKKNNISTGTTSVIAVEVPDCPGGLAEVMQKIDKSGLNVKYMYSIPEKQQGNAIMIMRFDNVEAVADTLTSKGLNILKQEDVISQK
jgi:hypothetical protein